MYDQNHEPTGEVLVELAEHLDELAASAAPGRSIDIARAVRDGRVRLRRRRFATVGAVAVAAAAAMTVSLLPFGGGSAQRSVAAAPPASAPAVTTDPLVVEASYGLLPAGYQVNYEQDQGSTVAQATGKVPEGGSARPMIWLKVYPAGTTPSIGRPFYPGGPRQYRVPAAPVDGRPAYWVGKGPTTAWAPAGDWYLRWETADGRWAEMQASYLTGTEASQTLHRIAEKVVVSRRPVPLPYRISGLPAAVKLSGADLLRGQSVVNHPNAPWTTSVDFMVDGMAITTTISTSPPAKPPADPDAPPQAKQTCAQAQGLSVCTASQYGLNAYHAVGGPEAWLKKFTLLGADEHLWTTHVLG